MTDLRIDQLAITWDLDGPQLVETSLARGVGALSEHGAFVVSTAPHTGRSPKDKFIVEDVTTADTVWWDNASAMTPAQFSLLKTEMLAHAAERGLFGQRLFAGADAAHRFDVDVVTESPWHALFIRNLLSPRTADTGGARRATILHMPGFKADPARHGTRTEVAIALDFTNNVVLIAGSAYAGEIKKSVFSLFNFHAPADGVFPMHCSANVGRKGDTALFFGLSGTGKTTLSNDPRRQLIGDDEHGWSADGVFNLEGGCYAKTAKLSAEAEPAIHAATRMAGTVLENVAFDPATGAIDYDDISLTENGRAAYPMGALDNVAPSGTGGTPKNVVFLCADAFGVLPPIARLTTSQAIDYFLAGYTAKLAGTERGVTEPQATFSVCFGAPFMSRHPRVYARLLAERLADSGAEVWLVNTGWTGGGYGVGKRMAIGTTRRLVDAALGGELTRADVWVDPVFGLAVPTYIEGVEPKVLRPRDTWADGAAYDREAESLAERIRTTVAKFGKVDADERDGVMLAAE